MRNGFAQRMVDLAREDNDIYVLVGDIGFRIFDEFRSLFSERFINCGIAEQNMIGVAAGLASEGKKVFVYTIIPFLVMRAFEQIRVDVGINKSNIVLVGVGAGLAYDKLGPTHHAYEDIAIMRLIPGMVVSLPYDRGSTVKAIDKAYYSIPEQSSYIRLSKGGEPDINKPAFINEDLCTWKVRDSRAVIISHGALLNRFANMELQKKYKFDVIGVVSFSELTAANIINYLYENKMDNKWVVVCEESFRCGGVFEAICTELILSGRTLRIKSKAFPFEYRYEIDSREGFLDKQGFNISNVLKDLGV